MPPVVIAADLLKAHVDAYTRKDGVQVKEHEDSRAAARPRQPAQRPAGRGNNEDPYGHPHVVGKAEKPVNYQWGGPGTGASKPVAHKGPAMDATEITFRGKVYRQSGRGQGKSLHDGTPVQMFESEDGHRIWIDKQDRVHADATSEVPKLRAEYEAHQGAKPEKSAASAPKDVPDEHNPEFALSQLKNDHLQAAVSGKDDLNRRARFELAQRGQDSDGKWIGFDAAAKHHSVSGEQAPDPDEDHVHGHFQTVHSKVLSAAAKGEVDLNQQAASELKKRGVKYSSAAAKPDLYKALESKTVLAFSCQPGIIAAIDASLRK